jgi:hypothetical protein
MDLRNFFRIPEIIIPDIKIPKIDKDTYFYEKKISENIVNENNKIIVKKDIYENDNGKITKKHDEKIIDDTKKQLLIEQPIKIEPNKEIKLL